MCVIHFHFLYTVMPSPCEINLYSCKKKVKYNFGVKTRIKLPVFVQGIQEPLVYNM